ncbi:MAG: RHS repeat-associated core domain-containing protein [Candidatus Sumerlaeia bacterium]
MQPASTWVALCRAIFSVLLFIPAVQVAAADFDLRDGAGKTVLRIDAGGNAWLAGPLEQNQPLGPGPAPSGWSVRGEGGERAWVGVQDGALPSGTLRLSGVIHPTTDTSAVADAVYSVRGAGGATVAVFRRNGDLNLAGRVFENAAPIDGCRPEAGVLQFACAKYETEEGALLAEILVARTGGTTGAVTVHYATADATARAGEDYSAAGGTLTLADGDESSTFTVPILSGPAVEGTESLRLELSDPRGGCRLGAVHHAELVIHELPPDPVEAAPAIDRTLPTSARTASRFIYDPAAGRQPIQTGVTSGTIEAERAAVFHGTVYGRSGETSAPLAGVTVTILERPELGRTLTRADGSFDLVVNGGGTLPIRFEKSGWLEVIRRTPVSAGEWRVVEPVCLTPKSRRYHYVDLLNAVEPTTIALDATEDADGRREGRLLFMPGTHAELVAAGDDTETTPVSGINIYFNEFTVGGDGPASMPAELDPAVAYTYCMEIGVLEAEAAGAPTVHFDRPVIYYVENFLGFPVGVNAPSGSFTRQGLTPPGQTDKRLAGRWASEPNGRVIKILGVDQGSAVLDLNGGGQPATAAELAAFGIDPAELAMLAADYAAGDELWRVPLTHFTEPKDYNWPVWFFGHILDIIGSSFSSDNCKYWIDQLLFTSLIDDIIGGWGSLDVPNQIMRESVGIAGTPFSLNWSSDRAAGWRGGREIIVPLVGDAVPPDLVAVRVEIHIGGRLITHRVESPFTPNQSWSYGWDGLDAWGRPLEGWQRARVSVGWEWPGFYGYPAGSFKQMQAAYNYNFGLPSDPALFDPLNAPYGTGIITRARTQTTWRRSEIQVAPAARSDCGWFTQGQGIGGWTPNVHHGYDPERGILFMGDGRRLETAGFHALSFNRFVNLIDLLQTFSVPTPYSGLGGMDVGPDGALYVTDWNGNYVWRLKNPRNPRKRDYEIFAGTGYGDGDYTTGDGGIAILAQLIGVKDIAAADDGNIYVTQGYSVRRIDREGIIRTYGGLGSWQSADPSTYDGRFAREIKFGPHSSKTIKRIAAGRDGSIFILQSSSVVFRVDPSGRIYHYAGSSADPDAHEDVPATLSAIYAEDIDIGPDGSLYIVENNRIRRVDATGIIRTIAGGVVGTQPTGGDGSPANQARIAYAKFIEVARDGTIYFLQGAPNFYLRTVTADGRVFTVAGNGSIGYGGDKGPASRASLGVIPGGLALDRKGTIYLSNRSSDGWPRMTDVARIEPIIPKVDAGDILIPDCDAGTIYHFSEQGRHLETLDADNYEPILTFDYDTTGRLATITDAFDNVTRIERDAQGTPRSIVAPFDQATSLTFDGEGRLAAVGLPGNRRTSFGYGAGDMLTTVTGARRNDYQFDYDETGLLVLARDPVGGATSFSRVAVNGGDEASGHAVVTTTSLGVANIHAEYQQPDGTFIQVLTAPDNTVTTQTWRKDLSATIVSSDGTIQEIESGPSARDDMGLLYPFVTLSRTRMAGLETLTTHSQVVEYDDYSDDPADYSQTDYYLTDGRLSRSTISEPDDDGRREITTVSPLGRSSRSVIDRWGRPVETGLPNVEDAHYEYDGHGRLWRLRTGDGDDARVIRYAFDSRGLVANVTDPLGRQSIYEYDAADRLTTHTLPGGARVGYEYDASGNLTAVAPPGRPAYRFEYSPRSEMTASRSPAGNARDILYEFDLDRRPSRVELPSGAEIRYDYDPAGRLVRTHAPLVTLRNEYDSLGRAVLTGDGTTTFSYRYSGSLPLCMRIDGPVSGTVTSVLGAGFRRLSTSLYDNTSTCTLTYGEDDDGLPTRIGALHLEYRPDNTQLTRAAVGDGETTVSTSFGYNSFGELSTLAAERLAGGDPIPLYDAQFARDKLGRITNQLESVSGGGSSERYYFYDLAGRLRATSDGATTLTTYTYDANGNRLARWSQTEGTVEFNYDTLDRLTGDSLGHQWQYNADGQLTTRTLGAARTVLNYAATGELLGVSLPDGRQVAYTVDPLGRRVERRVDGRRTDAWLYSAGAAPIARIEAGRVRDLYVYGLRAHVPDYLVRFGNDGTSTTWRLITDQRASVRLVVNVATGAVGQRLGYDDFGRVTEDTSPGFQPFGFAGGLYDPATGLVRFGARDYDPETARWTTLDPIGFSGGLNLYGYCVGDPINGIDPDGLDWLENSSNCIAGFFDNMTFGLTALIREAIGINSAVDHNSSWYRGGEVAEIAVELAITGGSAVLKHLAAKASRKAVRSAAATLVRPLRQPGMNVHHINPLFGHPGGFPALFPTGGLPAWIHSGRRNLMLVAEHTDLHRRIRRLENMFDAFLRSLMARSLRGIIK